MTQATSQEIERWKAVSIRRRDTLLRQAHAAKSMREQSQYVVRARLVQIEIDKWDAPTSGANAGKGGEIK